ncbi:MAG: hypothetical protein NTZ13_03350 [Candidatus Parcubacteria bacterium]|nr:hypothetical protein [Candidatus Parcubacteria bacterium]
MITEAEKDTTHVTEETPEAEKTVETPVYAVFQGQVLSRQEALEWDSK